MTNYDLNHNVAVQVHEMSQGMQLTCDVEAGDQAMVIRNHLGDWAICVARWHVSNASTGKIIELENYFRNDFIICQSGIKIQYA